MFRGACATPAVLIPSQQGSWGRAAPLSGRPGVFCYFCDIIVLIVASSQATLVNTSELFSAPGKEFGGTCRRNPNGILLFLYTRQLPMFLSETSPFRVVFMSSDFNKKSPVACSDMCWSLAQGQWASLPRGGAVAPRTSPLSVGSWPCSPEWLASV